MSDLSTFPYVRHRLTDDPRRLIAWVSDNWATNRKLRVISYAAGVLVVLLVLAWATLARNLPDANSLLDYETPLPTVVRGVDGEIVHSYARERRVQLQYADFPEQMIEAYLSAEDKTFFSHNGVDLTGTLNAAVDYLVKFGSGERAVGGSTITQQVAKNLLLGDEYSITRKLKEMILATRIESVLTKQEILELYLNEIPLGRRSFGVQAAARAYFDKDVGDLDLHETAFLAILPKAPERYGRERYRELALVRRDFVLDQMQANGFVSAADAAAAKRQPLGLVQQRSERSADAGYFLEEVRRQLIDQFGETAEDGENSVYAGGLWVRTSLDTELQEAARDALRAQLLSYHGNRGFTGPVATLNPENGDLHSQLASSNLSINYEDWQIGVITAAGSSATIGFTDGEDYPLVGAPSSLKVGDVVAAAKSGDGYRLRGVPEVSGAFLAEAPQTGRILAMQGGFDSRLGAFNRATQAERQPGSTIKPFVYASALDHGMTPATEVPDQTFCVWQGAQLGEKCFRNFGGGGGGVHTMRWGLEQSRNLMTIHIADTTGMPNVVQTIKRLGIGEYEPYYSFALGAGDTTVARMVNAYSALANWGRQTEGSVIDYVQDRDGKVIFRSDKRECTGCNMEQWDGQPMPRFEPEGRQVLDPRTAFQVVHMLKGVVTRGTAVRLRSLDLPMFGKTGTTNGPTNAWFVGGTPDIVAGMYVGFDQPRNLGGWVQGGNTAATIMKRFVEATRDRWDAEDFIAPPGIRMVKIDRRSGKRVFDATPSDEPTAAVIWEAFKPDTEPPRATRGDAIAAKRNEILDLIRRARQGPRQAATSARNESEPADFVEEQGGIY
ncbi:transglycosylase domain-containing protein [Qipengyuania sp. XHP0207]|uniref:penicillin-binding protein 1A n=1 Tax=Qipengyuania sp. XHP0207 TaxID=3038078 RepID=UPI00241CB845|nr:transglycosylase domain-containing protein [Qipengyuania sp. XHP0207]MDG5747470.1 transglycosylase domain-containing protein [Qipengyuania sp. XHP0207]